MSRLFKTKEEGETRLTRFGSALRIIDKSGPLANFGKPSYLPTSNLVSVAEQLSVFASLADRE